MRVVDKITTGPNHWDGDENHSVTITHEEGDYTTPDGFHHIGGVHRVTATMTMAQKAYRGKVYKGRAKTFRGETAWMDAERLFSDIITEVRFARLSQ